MIRAPPIQQQRPGFRAALADHESSPHADHCFDSIPLVPARIHDEEIGVLQLLHLTLYEAKAYLALIKNGPLKASEAGFLGHVPRPKVYGALRHLQRKGLVHIAPSNPATFRAASPKAVLKAKADELVDQATLAQETLEKLAKEHELTKHGPRRSELPREANELWYIDGREHIYNRVAQMLERATDSISYYATPAGLVRAYKAHSECLENAAKRGAAVRVLGQASKDNHMVARELAAIVKIRKTTKPLAANFVCIDGRELVVIENSPNDFDVRNGTDKAAWTTNELLVELYEDLFERVWDNASPV